ncbi:A/G-specific DNA-adenine glycosylase [Balneicella halophila]|uniref:Adenine DNA glycosylase n=1 Tax=Balneicella halophila TaxID=1537566 RepID=A0A7L4UML3_BALHA|nr:A/G-specific adenine glycosylase [Balneicella halophila]PVX49382.1 A/G-specific DNA-adenine glycosylase [Balneicella halophila]
MQEFSVALLGWYHKNKRDLPWRKTKNPYKIWLSEIILQQTRVDQGLKYYLSFLEHFPTLFDLAKASEQEVLKLWQGLGYYSRARNLHFTAKFIVNELDGKFPDNYNELLQLKGVGKYTAAAIASFAYDEAVPAIDGNVYRLFSRLFGIYTPIHTTKAQKEFFKIVSELIHEKEAGYLNQATMELGAIVCRPRNPDCEDCPLAFKCWAFEKNKQHELPVKKAKIQIKHRYFNYFIIEQEEGKILHLREQKDIWRHLYQFPLLERKNPLLEEIENFIVERFGTSHLTLSKINETPIIHKLSHQHLHLTFWKVTTDKIQELPKWHCFVNEDNVSKLPVPKSIESYI